MRKVTCAHCQFGFTAREEDVGSHVVCPNCNTRRQVPGDAVRVEEKPIVPHPVMPYLPRPPKPPEYSLVIIAGILLMVVGVVTILAGLAMAIDRPRVDSFWNALQAGAGGILLMGFGQLLFCVRDIARNTWRNVH